MWPVTYRLILASKNDPRAEDDALVEDDPCVEGALGCGRSLTG